MKTLLTIVTLLVGCDRSMNDSWLHPKSCDRPECYEAEGYNIMSGNKNDTPK